MTRRQRGRPEASIPEPGSRIQRLAELVREEVNHLLRNEVRDARLDGVVVTQAELSRDGSSARLWFTAPDDSPRDEPVIEALLRASGFLRSQLGDALGLKRTPELTFRRDPATRTLVPDAPVVAKRNES